MWGALGSARIRAVPRARALLKKDAKALFVEERAEYHRWVGVLADRPSDAEMARWLALDKSFLKDDALRRADLCERDLVTHVVLTERAPFARKGRVTEGPPRYEAYWVHLFLLTHYGVRATRTRLDFVIAAISNEQRQMFPYDAVASASVVETGRRTFDTDGSSLVDIVNERVFQLTLVNGTNIAEVKENPQKSGGDGLADDDDLAGAVSAQASSFDGALRILEAVATEGRDWIIRDQERKRRWARHWGT